MRIDLQVTELAARPKDEKQVENWRVNMMHRLSTIFKGLDQVINGLLTFGDGLTQDNILGAWVTVADTGAANTDFAVTHNLGQIPPGFLLMIPPVTGAINLGVTPWTKSQIFLRCSTANQKATFFVLGSPLTY